MIGASPELPRTTAAAPAATRRRRPRRRRRRRRHLRGAAERGGGGGGFLRGCARPPLAEALGLRKERKDTRTVHERLGGVRLGPRRSTRRSPCRRAPPSPRGSRTRRDPPRWEAAGRSEPDRRRQARRACAAGAERGISRSAWVIWVPLEGRVAIRRWRSWRRAQPWRWRRLPGAAAASAASSLGGGGGGGGGSRRQPSRRNRSEASLGLSYSSVSPPRRGRGGLLDLLSRRTRPPHHRRRRRWHPP